MSQTGETLENLCACPKGQNPHMWYQQTGGNSFRLKIAYVLINDLLAMRTKRLQFNCLTPSNIHIIDAKRPSLLIDSPNYEWPSKDFPIEYSDPLVLLGRAYDSQSSIAFSCAIIVFQMLTGCHPYHGEDYYSDSKSDQQKRTLVGDYDYIGDSNTINTNELFEWENTQSHMSLEIAELMQRMFIRGKLFPAERPSLFSLRTALLNSLRNTLICSEKPNHPDYDATRLSLCPHCGQKHKTPAVLRSWFVFSSNMPLMIPQDLKGNPTTIASPQKQINKMFLREGVNLITRSMLDPFFTEEEDSIFLRIELTPFSATISNSSTVPFFVEDSIISSRSKKRFPLQKLNDINYDLLSVQTQETVIADTVYGVISCKGFLEIGGLGD